MDLQEPQHSPSPDTDKSDTETLRSATPSQNNTLGSFKPLPETEALFLPEWGRSQEAVSWFLKLRKVLKGIIYRYCGALQKALLIFELNDATDSVHYTLLTQFLQKVWVRWKEFNDRKIITTTFLSSSVICDDLSKPVAWMRRMASPRNAAPWCAKEMTQLIHTVRQAATELFWNRGLIEDAKARLVEANDGHHVSLFCDLPAPDPDDHESLPSEDEDTDSGEMVLYSREMKDPKLLLENGLEPIWVEGYGYPGPVPQEIDDHLGSNGGRFLSMVGSIRSIFWLFGYKDLVQVVDDPACILEDEIVSVPRNTNPIGYLVDYYSEQGKMPLFIEEVCDGVRFRQSFHAARP